MSLALRNIVFTFVVPGTAAVYLPLWIVTPSGARPVAWHALALVGIGLAVYLSCVWVFALVGRGTPGPWDAPRRLVAVGPYRWVRNPMYVAVIVTVLGEAWLFLSWTLAAYALALAVVFHLFVIAYEEPTLRHLFGASYVGYARTVSRWIPRPPRA